MHQWTLWLHLLFFSFPKRLLQYTYPLLLSFPRSLTLSCIDSTSSLYLASIMSLFADATSVSWPDAMKVSLLGIFSALYLYSPFSLHWISSWWIFRYNVILYLQSYVWLQYIDIYLRLPARYLPSPSCPHTDQFLLLHLPHLPGYFNPLILFSLSSIFPFGCTYFHYGQFLPRLPSFLTFISVFY